MTLTYYDICTRFPQYIDQYHISQLEPSYLDLRMVLRNCSNEVISNCNRVYGSRISYIVANHIEKGEPLELTRSVAEFCLQYEQDILHNLILNMSCPIIDSYNENDVKRYISKYPNDKLMFGTLEHCNDDRIMFHIITNNMCNNIFIKSLVGKNNIEHTLTYIILHNTTYNVNDAVECIEYCGYYHLYKLLDLSRFNFFLCSCKEKVLTRGIVNDIDILKVYFKLDIYNEDYLRVIKNKNMGGLILKLRRKYDMELLRKAHEYGITGIVMTVHYDDEVIGKGTPCYIHILLDLMDKLPPHLFNVNLVRVRYIDNIIRVLDRYNYYLSNNVDFGNVYHEGIMDYYVRYPKGVVDYIKSVKQDIVLALDIINGPQELHYLLDDKYSMLLYR